jgi:aerobic carbon-monoxide dehydrogenase small subunit
MSWGPRPIRGNERMARETKEEMRIRFVLNGAPCTVDAPPETTLLRLLRDHLLLTGTKCGCEIGQCGACTVILAGKAVASCLVLAGQIEGLTVETIEGLGEGITQSGEGLHPLQRAFLDCDAVACGFCTPGMLMTAKALLDANPGPTREEIRRAISGNLCRCTGYLPIIEAIEQAAGRTDTRERKGIKATRGACRRQG